MPRDGRLHKRIQYRDQVDVDVEAHALHWLGFVWQAGPVIVAAIGTFGTVQVWAISEDEGKRVIRHAAAIGGFDPDDPRQGRWVVTSASSDRVGKVGRMVTEVRRDRLMVSKRDGPVGAPEAFPVMLTGGTAHPKGETPIL